MKRFLYPFILSCFLLNGISAACSTPLNSNTQVEIETPTSMVISTGTATVTHTPTELVPTITATPEFAPICDPDPPNTPTASACQFPLAEESTTFCAKKSPYNLIIMNLGATYEAIGENFECSDAGTKDGKQLVTCTGPMVSTFGVNVCDPACAIPTVQADLTQCPQGYVFNNIQGCCSQFFQPTNQNCELLILKTKSCVVDCSVFTKKSTCDKNFIACEWNGARNVCQLRR